MIDASPRSFSADFSARIPRPSPDRPPLRVNAYEHAQIVNTSLAPMFPYIERGAIVPATTLFTGGPGADFGHFFHENTEEEVALVIADRNGIKSRGMIMIAPQLHGVQAFLKEPEDPQSFLLIVITQRQREEGAQRERVFFRCGCNQVLYEERYDATPPDVYDPHNNSVFTTNVRSAEIARAFNADVAHRTCTRCGKVAPPFPVEAWGWTQYETTSATAAAARRRFENGANA